ncbi:hypothetical protein [Citrobacter sp. Marseille-Q6884]|uniref:hypothetical protein n=1 Tax=Citrobacter sp. Marseille-Q6884 TaxID=2956786 RepID=UPI0021B355DA|nr:hypothetical protein [Citrobacter sp. Marseille-Q6884]
MSVKRYWSYAGGDSSMQETETGNYVKYEDYASLERKNIELAVQIANAESKCRELAGVVAENADLKSLIEQHAGSIAVCPNCSHEEPSETDDIVALYRSMETPGTKVFIAEVGAQAVEACAESLLSNDDIGINSEYALMRDFAAQLRKGAAL